MVQHKTHPDTVLVALQNGERYEIDVQFNNFVDGDSHCLIKDTDHIKGARIIIKHYLYPNQNEQIVRLLLLAGTLKDLGAGSIEAFAPYLPYARQDKAHFPGEAVAAELVCRVLNQAGISTLHTIDCHFMKGASTASVEGLRIHNNLVQDLLTEHLEILLSGQSYHVVGPDAGASYLAGGQTMKKTRARAYAKDAGGSIGRDVAELEDRHLDIGDGVIVVADDMVSTGSTMVKALQSLQARGAKKLFAMTTHGLFLKDSFQEIDRLTTGLVYADTVPLKDAVPVVDKTFAAVTRKYLR